MIIFGTRGITSSANSGVFHCPRCGPQRRYDWKKVNRWFTLYFIPVIPLGAAGEYVECTNCAGTFGTEVINYDPQAEQSRTLDEIKRLLVLAALSHGPGDDVKVANIQSAYAGLTNIHLMPEEILEEFRLATSAGATLVPYAQRLAGNFNDQGKGTIVAAAGAVIAPGRALSTSDVQLLTQLATALGMSRASTESVLRQIQG